MNNKDFTVYMMCGLPGAGKSTYVSRFLSDKIVISSDRIRCKLHIGGSSYFRDLKCLGNDEQEREVHDILENKLIECCEKKQDCVLDDPHLTFEVRKNILLKIRKYNPKVKIIYIEPPGSLDTCIKRRKGQIWRGTLEQLYKDFDFPQPSECDELIINKT